MDFLTALPPEIQEQVVGSLDAARDLSALACTAKHWNRMVRGKCARDMAIALKALHRSLANFDARHVTDVPLLDSPRMGSGSSAYDGESTDEERLYIAWPLDAILEIDMPRGPIFVTLRRSFQRRVSVQMPHWRWSYCVFPESSNWNVTDRPAGRVERAHSPAEAICLSIFRAGREWAGARPAERPHGEAVAPAAATRRVQSRIAKKSGTGGSALHPFDARAFAQALQSLLDDPRIGRNESAAGHALCSGRLATLRKVHVGGSHLGELATALAEAKVTGRGTRILTRRSGRAVTGNGDEDPVANSIAAEPALRHAFVECRNGAFATYVLRTATHSERPMGSYASAGDAFSALARYMYGDHLTVPVLPGDYKGQVDRLVSAWTKLHDGWPLPEDVPDDDSTEALAMLWEEYGSRPTFTCVPDRAGESSLVLSLDRLQGGSALVAFLRITTPAECRCARTSRTTVQPVRAAPLEQRRSTLGLPPRRADVETVCECTRDGVHAIDDTNSFRNAREAARTGRTDAHDAGCNDPIAAVAYRRESDGTFSASLRGISGPLPGRKGGDELVVVGNRSIATSSRSAALVWDQTRRYLEGRLPARKATTMDAPYAPSSGLWLFVEKVSA